MFPGYAQGAIGEPRAPVDGNGNPLQQARSELAGSGSS